MAIEMSFKFPFTQIQTPMISFFLVTQRWMLVARKNIWLCRLELALIGRDLGRRPDLLPDSHRDWESRQMFPLLDYILVVFELKLVLFPQFTLEFCSHWPHLRHPLWQARASPRVSFTRDVVSCCGTLAIAFHA